MEKRASDLSETAERGALGALFAKFALSGAAGTSLHYSVFLFLVTVLNIPSGASAFVGAACGACAVYVLNRRFTFGSSVAHAKALPRFAAMSLVGAAMNGAIVGWLSHVGVHFLLAQIIATLIVLFVNFVVSKKWIYR